MIKKKKKTIRRQDLVLMSAVIVYKNDKVVRLCETGKSSPSIYRTRVTKHQDSSRFRYYQPGLSENPQSKCVRRVKPHTTDKPRFLW